LDEVPDKEEAVMSLGIIPGTLSALGLAPEDAAEMVRKLDDMDPGIPAGELWGRVSREVLSPDVPFPVHLHLYKSIFKDWDHSQGPPPAWTPTERDIADSNIAALTKKAGLASVHDLHRWSVEHRAEFWGQVIEALGVKFKQHPSAVVDLRRGLETPRWLPDARLNIAESCFLAAADAPAILHQAEGGKIEVTTYGELDRLSNRFARALAESGLPRSASVALVMPMTLEVVAAYLGVIKAGYAVASIADSFAPDEITTRMRLAKSEAAVTLDVMPRAGKALPMYRKVVDAGAARVVVVRSGAAESVTLREQDVWWEDFLAEEDTFEAVSCDPDDLSNVLFSSGTTGDPKAIPWTHTSPIKCAMDGHLHHDIRPGEVIAWPTSIGWMMGPWHIYATLMNRATMALYYGAPNTREFCEFVQNTRVAMLGLVPSLVKAWQNADLVRGLDWSSIKLFSSTGETSKADDYLYLMSLANYRPIVEYCGGTEISGGYITGSIVQPASPATFSTAAFGLDFHILDEHSRPAAIGELFLVPPSIGLSNTLLNKDHHEVYYADTPPGPNGELLRRHGDEMEALAGGFYRAHGRADDTMNLGGIKVSSAEIERTLGSVDGVVETAAVAFNPPDGGPSLLVIYAVMLPEASLADEALKKEMQRAIAGKLNPLFKIHEVVPVAALPRTASNKVMRRVLRDEYGRRSEVPGER
jgi:acetyl-CoA synthetase